MSPLSAGVHGEEWERGGETHRSEKVPVRTEEPTEGKDTKMPHVRPSRFRVYALLKAAEADGRTK